MTKDTTNSLSHTRWKCKYHLVFAPKFRRQIVYGKIREDVGRILRTLCEQKKVEIHEAEACPDHIHMLVSIPPHLSVAQFVGYLKGKSSLMIFDRHANLKYKYGNRHFWCRGYFVDTVGANKNAIAEYIRHQLDEDIAYEQLSLKEYFDPFTGGKNKQALTTTGRLCKIFLNITSAYKNSSLTALAVASELNANENFIQSPDRAASKMPSRHSAYHQLSWWF